MEIHPCELPVFWACGCPSGCCCRCAGAFCIIHTPGCLLITDIPNAHLASL
ncbi:MAG: D-glutamate cyclase family protein [Candidatus Malihini olakiniferum]